jgi:F-type H+-transporting ATPase subunit b
MILSSIVLASETGGAELHEGFFQNPENWVALTWLIVVALLARKVYRSIVEKLDARQNTIRNRIEEAETLHAEAQELLSSYQKNQRDALKQAEKIITDAKEEAKRIYDIAKEEQQERLKRLEQQAFERIRLAEIEALTEIRHHSIDIAIKAMTEILEDHMSKNDSMMLIDKTIKDLPHKLNS